MNDTEIFNDLIDLIDGLSELAFRTNNESLLQQAIELESFVTSTDRIDSDVLLDLSISVDSISNTLFDTNPDIAIGLTDIADKFEGKSYELLEIEYDLESIADDDSESEIDIDSFLETVYTERRELLTDLESEIAEVDNVDYEGTDLSIAEQHGLEIVYAISDNSTIRPRSASTQIEDVIDYITEIGIDGIARIYYAEDEDLYYAEVDTDTQIGD